MVTFVGAGPGAKDLITVRGQRLLEEADIVIYAGSLVNPKLLYGCKETCAVYNSAKMTLEEVLEVIKEGETQRKNIVRLHTGDPCLYGAIKEQMDELERLGIGYEVCPGVSSFCAAAAALDAEYTLPGISQSVVITRMAGRTPVPEKESIRSRLLRHPLGSDSEVGEKQIVAAMRLSSGNARVRKPEAADLFGNRCGSGGHSVHPVSAKGHLHKVDPVGVTCAARQTVKN